MITIIASTNRNESRTELFAQHCYRQMKEMGEEVRLFSLQEIPNEIPLNSIYDQENSGFYPIAKEYIEPAQKFLFVLPEYNGGFPGVLKLFVDAIAPKYFKGKKAALVGVAAGHAGNLRGMDHFSDVLNYLGVHTLPKRLSIARIEGLIENGELKDAATIEALSKQLQSLSKF